MTTLSSTEHEPNRRQPFAVRDAMSTRLMVTLVTSSLLILVASSAIAWDGEVPGWEADALRWVNDWPDWIEPIMWTLQQVGVLAGPLIGGIVIAGVARRWEYLIPFVLLMPLKLFIEKAVIKQLVERQRPFVSIGPDIIVRGPAFEGLSFPSGHATTSVAFGILVAAFVPPRWRPLPLLWAAAVCVARIHFGEHNLLDVVAGAALGTLFATILWFTILNRWVEPDAEPPA